MAKYVMLVIRRVGLDEHGIEIVDQAHPQFSALVAHLAAPHPWEKPRRHRGARKAAAEGRKNAS